MRKQTNKGKIKVEKGLYLRCCLSGKGEFRFCRDKKTADLAFE